VRLLPLFLYLLLIAFHQTILRDATAIATVSIDLAGFVVLAVALYKSEFTSLWFGFLAGVVSVAAVPAEMGWNALVMAALGWTAFHFRGRLNLESIFAKLGLIAGGIFVHNIALIILRGGDGFLIRILSDGLPGALYTTVLAWLFFLVKEKRITFEKIKPLF